MQCSFFSVLAVLASLASPSPVIEDIGGGQRIECDVAGDRVADWKTCGPYFEESPITTMMYPKSCWAPRCMGDCQISVCNDNDWRVEVHNSEIKAASQLIFDKCVAKDNPSVKGQVFHDAKNWNVIIKNSPCPPDRGQIKDA